MMMMMMCEGSEDYGKYNGVGMILNLKTSLELDSEAMARKQTSITVRLR
jgi:hypothetical protein